eukprot:TRINITY_DN11260_c0_g1_i2.p1 TRINITY_DN11260_c0_g1~~TRINITY_DN11260_c0_g1_i2.p1  ORF type:complete len:177 (-),score=30.44 TRINITY_DN11260_c0_g1_i2:71-544(-)
MGPMANSPLLDSSMFNTMMKRNVAMIVSNVVLFSWVDHFFSGFVAVKLPFTLTGGFRAMLQGGIDLSGLDIRYVTSMSWYILILFGLRGVLSLVLGENNEADDAKMMQSQMAMQQAGPDPTKVYTEEKESLEILKHTFALEGAEENLWKKWTSEERK